MRILILCLGLIFINCTTISEDCSNGADDDGDGLIDCLDVQCQEGNEIVINEVMYNPDQTTDEYGEYIELRSYDYRCIDTAGWSVTIDGIDPTFFPMGVYIYPGDTFIFAKTYDLALSCGVTADGLMVPYTTLNNEEENITVWNEAHEVMAYITYC